MCPSNRRSSASAPLLFLLAGVAFLAVALLHLRQQQERVSVLVMGMQLLAAALFFIAAYLHHRRLR